MSCRRWSFQGRVAVAEAYWLIVFSERKELSRARRNTCSRCSWGGGTDQTTLADARFLQIVVQLRRSCFRDHHKYAGSLFFASCCRRSPGEERLTKSLWLLDAPLLPRPFASHGTLDSCEEREVSESLDPEPSLVNDEYVCTASWFTESKVPWRRGLAFTSSANLSFSFRNISLDCHSRACSLFLFCKA